MLKEERSCEFAGTLFCIQLHCAAGGISAKHQASSIKRKPEWDFVPPADGRSLALMRRSATDLSDVPAAPWNADVESVSTAAFIFF